jgi:hypothetical protein
MSTLAYPTPSRSAPFGASAAPPRSKSIDLPGTAAVPAELLDGGEIVLLTLKPSAWFLVFEPVKWIATAVVLIACIASLDVGTRWAVPPHTLIQLVLLVAGGRLLITTMRWVSRFYVLTNRRVMRVSGIRRPHAWSCPLVRVRNTRVSATAPERITRIGTIDFVPDNSQIGPGRWAYVDNPDAVHDTIRRAIRRAIDNHSIG